MKIFLLLFVTFLVPSTIAAACKDGDFYHDGYCYMTPLFTNKDGMTHNDAQAYCSKNGAHLPVFHNPEQEGFVTLMAIRIFGKGVNWIGLNHPGKWDDGSKVDYVNWGSGCPTNKSHCVMEYFNHKNSNEGNWRDDYNCSHVAKFFCQYSTTQLTTVLPPKPISKSCKNYWFGDGKRCYSYSAANDTQTYQGAKSKCEQNGQTLVVLETSNDAFSVGISASLFYDWTASYWIGLRRDGDQYFWPDGSKLLYNNWNPGNPVDKYPGAVQQVSPSTFSSVSDDTKLPYVCSGTFP